MKSKPSVRSNVKLGVLAIAITCLGMANEALGCGEFKLPRDHFEGVNETGAVSHWDQIGSIDLGDVKIPLVIGFQSDREWTSKSLGQGWILAIADSNILQKDANTFVMIQPDGYTTSFGRDAKESNILHGSAGWKGRIRGDEITAYSACGGWKLIFEKGKLSSLIRNNHVLQLVRDESGRLTEIRDGARPIVRVEKDANTGLASLLEVGDQRIAMNYDTKPRIQSVGGQNLIVGADPSLRKVTLPDGTEKTYEFGVDEKIQPTLKLEKNGQETRIISWDVAGRIIRDGDWSYTITPSVNPSANAAIQRARQDGAIELWHFDATKGTEVSLTADGTKVVKSWFTGGKLAGKLRNIQHFKDNATTLTRNFSYDEKGRILRKTDARGTSIAYSYDTTGKKIRKIVHQIQPTVQTK